MDQDLSLNIDAIKKRSIHGVTVLVIRTFFVQAFTFFATFILTVILDPAVFGIFFLVSSLINFLVYFSDIGLAAALIQKKEELTSKDLSSTFTIQQIIILVIVLVGLIFSKPLANFYALSDDGLLLLRVLIFSLFLSSLKTIPSIILERKLLFAKLIIPQIAENVAFYTVAIILAIKGFGISSFAYAVILRGVIGLTLIYAISPWKPSVNIDKSTAKKLISFGIPFQLNSILALLKDDLLTIILGKILSFSQLGYVGWAQKWAFTPLRFFMDNVIKVTFPSYARLQKDKKYLGYAIEKSLFFVTFTVYPMVCGIVAIVPLIVFLVPRYQKWDQAIPLLYLYGINAMFAAVNTTLANTLFALGKPKIILKLMVFWTALTWILTYLLLKIFGYYGVALASALVAASTSVIIIYVKREVEVRIFQSIKGALFASLAMFICLKAIGFILPNTIFELIVQIFVGCLFYFVISYLIYGQKIISDIKTLVASFAANK